MDLTLTSISLLSPSDCNNGFRNGEEYKLKKGIKQLYHYLSNYALVTVKWLDSHAFRGLLFVFANGVFTSVSFGPNHTFASVYHETFLQSKFDSRRVSNVEIKENFILVSYIEPFVTLVSLEGNNPKRGRKGYGKFKMRSHCSVRTIGFEKYSHRQAKRNLLVSYPYAALWWNTFRYHKWTHPDLNHTENNLVMIDLDTFTVITSHSISGEFIKCDFTEDNSGKLGVLFRPSESAYDLTYRLYQVIPKIGQRKCDQLNISFETNIPLEKVCFYAEFTRSQDKILLLCDDESVMLYNVEQNVLYLLHSSKSICYLSCNPLDSIFATCDQYGHISFYDFAFNSLAYKTKQENLSQESCEVTPKQMMTNMSVKRLQFVSPKLLLVLLVENKRRESKSNLFHSASKGSNNCYLRLLCFPHKVSFKRLINEYLHASKFEEALNMLRVINWNCAYEEAFWCLNTVFQHLLNLSDRPELEPLIESTLATFLIPMTPIDYKIFETILPYIRHLAIRFFYHLVRCGSLEKAYQLCVELKSARLFHFLCERAKQHGVHELASRALKQAKEIS